MQRRTMYIAILALTLCLLILVLSVATVQQVRTDPLDLSLIHI